jgi:competence protein ComEC
MISIGLALGSIVYETDQNCAPVSSALPFLEEVDPDSVVVSAGDGNRYGHPSQELLNKARLIGAPVLRSDELGTIRLSSDGKAIRWHTPD